MVLFNSGTLLVPVLGVFRQTSRPGSAPHPYNRIVRASALLFVLAALLPAQEPDLLKVERISSGYRFANAPAWNFKENYLLFSDLPASQVHRWIPGKGVEKSREAAASALAFDDRGRLLLCEPSSHRLLRLSSKGDLETLADRFESHRLNGPNDLTVRRDGHIYFTDPAFGRYDDNRELPFYGVYHLTPKLELSAIARLDKRPNGITLSPNGKLLYVASSDERAVRVFDLDRSGAASSPRLLITSIEGVPNGLATDERGNIYVACDTVAIYSPDGKLLRKIHIPEPPSNLAFGDPDRQSLYVTARTTLYRVRLDVKGSVQHE